MEPIVWPVQPAGCWYSPPYFFCYFLNLIIILQQGVTNDTSRADTTTRPSHKSFSTSLASRTLSETLATAYHQQVDASQLFMCHDLPGHTDYVTTMEFSDDGSHSVSGGGDATVRLWSLNQGWDGANSTVMTTKHMFAISCLAFSPYNNCIFSGACDKKIFIHDTSTSVFSLKTSSSSLHLFRLIISLLRFAPIQKSISEQSGTACSIRDVIIYGLIKF